MNLKTVIRGESLFSGEERINALVLGSSICVGDGRLLPRGKHQGRTDTGIAEFVATRASIVGFPGGRQLSCPEESGLWSGGANFRKECIDLAAQRTD